MRPGFKTSEFSVALLTVLSALAGAYLDYLSDPQAAKLSGAAVVAFIVSRGLAKVEQRPPGGMGGPP